MKRKEEKVFCLKFEKFFCFACCLPIKEQKKILLHALRMKKREGKNERVKRLISIVASLTTKNKKLFYSSLELGCNLVG